MNKMFYFLFLLVLNCGCLALNQECGVKYKKIEKGVNGLVYYDERCDVLKLVYGYNEIYFSESTKQRLIKQLIKINEVGE
jgi:hypothetical protein